MYKELHFPGMDPETGQIFTEAYAPGEPLLKLAAAKKYHPKLKKFLDNLKKSPNKIYVIVSALGAGEYYGANVNGDYFEEKELLNPDSRYGYTTFPLAGVYRHHVNKDKAKSLGSVVLAIYNPEMHRVELVIEVDKKKARDVGHESLVEALEKGEHVPVSMGCFTAGTDITMEDGSLRPIEEIRVGDLVLTHTGASAAVTDVMSHQHTGKLHVKIDGCPEVEVTEEHPYWVLGSSELRCGGKPSKGGQRVKTVCAPSLNTLRGTCEGCTRTSIAASFSWKRADELEVGDYVGFPIPSEERDVLTHDQMRFLGYYAAEGHILWDKNHLPCGVEFTLSEDDMYIIEELDELRERMGIRNVVGWRPREGAAAYSAYLYDAGIAHLCNTHVGRGAHEKRLGLDIMHAPPEAQAVFLGAYANGDGGAYKGSLYYSTCNKSLAEQLFTMLARCEMKASINVNHHKPNDLVNIETVEYQVWVGTDTSWKLSHLTRKPVHRGRALNSRRFFLTHEGTKYLISKVRDISEDPEWVGDVYNFSVEGDESYVAARTAVHNCKVKYDTCSICGNKSKTRKDYCRHALNQMNQVLPDGRKVFVYNPNPRFFDISFVMVGADKTSFVLEKVAASLAAPKVAAAKVSTIVKEIPELSEHLGPIFDKEQDLPLPALRRLCKYDVGDALGLLADQGVVAKPSEFQFLITAKKSPSLAESLFRRNTVFRPIGSPLGARVLSPGPTGFGFNLPSDFMQGRAASTPCIVNRITILSNAHPMGTSLPLGGGQEKLLSSLYMDYRMNLLNSIARVLQGGKIKTSHLHKEAAGSVPWWAALLPLVYLYSAHLRTKEKKHMSLNPLEKFVAHHPVLTTSTVAGAAANSDAIKSVLSRLARFVV